MHKETDIFKKLNQLKYDSTTPYFVEIESLVVSIVQIDEVLDYCKYAYVLDSPIANAMHQIGQEQVAINGIGLLQILFYQQNCIRSLYKYVTGESLKFSDDIKKIRKARNIIIGHPDERGFIPYFTSSGCWTFTFDEEKDYEELIYYEDMIYRQEKFIKSVLDKLIMYTNRLN